MTESNLNQSTSFAFTSEAGVSIGENVIGGPCYNPRSILDNSAADVRISIEYSNDDYIREERGFVLEMQFFHVKNEDATKEFNSRVIAALDRDKLEKLQAYIGYLLRFYE